MSVCGIEVKARKGLTAQDWRNLLGNVQWLVTSLLSHSEMQTKMHVTARHKLKKKLGKWENSREGKQIKVEWRYKCLNMPVDTDRKKMRLKTVHKCSALCHQQKTRASYQIALIQWSFSDLSKKIKARVLQRPSSFHNGVQGFSKQKQGPGLWSQPLNPPHRPCFHTLRDRKLMSIPKNL